MSSAVIKIVQSICCCDKIVAELQSISWGQAVAVKVLSPIRDWVWGKCFRSSRQPTVCNNVHIISKSELSQVFQQLMKQAEVIQC